MGTLESTGLAGERPLTAKKEQWLDRRPWLRRVRVPAVTGVIELDDRVAYAEAVTIVGRSRSYLKAQVRRGVLTRVGGGRRDGFATWLSRGECEALALQLYRRGHASDYWLTMAEAAQLLGIARQHAYKARAGQRLPTYTTRVGDLLVRRRDVETLQRAGAFRGRSNHERQPRHLERVSLPPPSRS